MKHLISFVANHVSDLLTFILGIPALYFLGEKDGNKARFGTWLKIGAVVGGITIFLHVLFGFSMEP